MSSGSDRTAEAWQVRICCKVARDDQDVIAVQEKLDGSCIAVTRIRGRLIPLLRSGREAITSKYEQHRHFHNWVFQNTDRFLGLLVDGERCIGEWLMQAHGTRYDLPHEPFVLFDLVTASGRIDHSTLVTRAKGYKFITPRLIHVGGPISIQNVLKRLEPSGHGAIDPVEGAVWRVERGSRVDFVTKYVRPEKATGCLLPERPGQRPVWNWRPV